MLWLRSKSLKIRQWNKKGFCFNPIQKDLRNPEYSWTYKILLSFLFICQKSAEEFSPDHNTFIIYGNVHYVCTTLNVHST